MYILPPWPLSSYQWENAEPRVGRDVPNWLLSNCVSSLQHDTDPKDRLLLRPSKLFSSKELPNPSHCADIRGEAPLSNYRHWWYQVPPGSFLNPPARINFALLCTPTYSWYLAYGNSFGMPLGDELLSLQQDSTLLEGKNVFPGFFFFFFFLIFGSLSGFSMIPSNSKSILNDIVVGGKKEEWERKKIWVSIWQPIYMRKV